MNLIQDENKHRRRYEQQIEREGDFPIWTYVVLAICAICFFLGLVLLTVT